jgi:hypothetical protein
MYFANTQSTRFRVFHGIMHRFHLGLHVTCLTALSKRSPSSALYVSPVIVCRAGKHSCTMVLAFNKLHGEKEDHEARVGTPSMKHDVAGGGKEPRQSLPESPKPRKSGDAPARRPSQHVANHRQHYMRGHRIEQPSQSTAMTATPAAIGSAIPLSPGGLDSRRRTV